MHEEPFTPPGPPAPAASSSPGPVRHSYLDPARRPSKNCDTTPLRHLSGPGDPLSETLEPAGARWIPLKLLDAEGAVAARGGQTIRVGGEVAPVYSRRRCTLGQRSAFFVMSEVPLPRAAAPAS